MKNIEHIRTKFFGVSQAAMAQIAGTTQATLSRIEAGDSDLKFKCIQQIRSAGIETFGDLWNDRFFFDPIESLPQSLDRKEGN